MLSRVVRIINVSIAVAAVLVAIAVYWYAVRPLPKTSGDVVAPISSDAVIKRDARGVPHIEAATWQDAIFLQGYATAQDRLWQMDSLRRFGSGELAEVFGAAAVPSDERSRRMRMRAIAEADVAQLSPADYAVMVAYARGVNSYIDRHRGDLPLEFSLPGHRYDPKPWTIADSVITGLVMFRDLTDTAQFETSKAALLEMGDPAKVRTLFPAVQGQFVPPGSNAWAVSGAHTADGKPLLANDPHLAFGIPGTWHLVHLKAPGLDVSGAALPGLPGVVSGHNEHIAWGVTNLQTDVLDLYAERLDERTGRYVYQGKVEQARLDREAVGVSGSKPVEVDIWVTRHGPIIEHAPGTNLSMRWTGAEAFHYPFLKIDRAQNWTQFRQAIQDFTGPAQNFVYADTAGNIGYQAAGAIPIRRNFDGDVPLDGASGQFEWSGFIPFDQLPTTFNPRSGIIATSNQSTFPPDYPYRVTGSFADRYRVEQDRARLGAKAKLTVADMLGIQKDVYSAYDRFLAQAVLKAVQAHGTNDQLVKSAAQILSGWNGQMERDEAAPMITQLLNDRLANALVAIAIQARSNAAGQPASVQPQNTGEKTGGRPASSVPAAQTTSNIPNILPRPQIIETLLRTRPAGWVRNDDWDAWLLENLQSALQLGRAKQGTPLTKWKWGRVLQWKLAHPIGKELPLVSGFFDIGPVPMSGSGTTIKQTTGTLGPSERMVVDLGNLDRSVQNLPAGESGFVASGHYKDQWPAYYMGESFPMQFEHVDAKETLHVKPH